MTIVAKYFSKTHGMFIWETVRWWHPTCGTNLYFLLYGLQYMLSIFFYGLLDRLVFKIYLFSSLRPKILKLQPAFVNNPLLGAVILAGLFLFDVEVGAGCILGGVTATVTDLLLGLHPLADLNSGVACFNGVLVGTVIPILYPAFYNTDRSLIMWLAVFGGAITRWWSQLDCCRE